MSTIKRRESVFDPGLCRFCGAMTQCRVLNEKYEETERKQSYSDMINNCFGIELSNLDSKVSEKLICIACVNKLHLALSFKIQVMDSEDAFLQSRMCTQNSKVQHKPCAEMKMEQLDHNDAEDNVMSDGLNDEIDGELLQEYYALESVENDSKPTLRKSVIQTTKESGHQTFINHSNDSNDTAGYSSTDDIPISTMKNEMHQTISQSEHQFVGNKPQQNSTSDFDSTDDPYKQTVNLKQIVKFSYVCPFRNRFNHILCYYCGQYYLDPELLREHTMTHDVTEFRAARNRYTKLDLTRIDCKLCKQRIKDLEMFKRHLVTTHMKQYFLRSKDGVLPFKLMGNVNKCAICGEEFPNFYALYKHMNEHFNNCICETCGIGFMDELSLQKHGRTHDTKRYPCDICDDTFKSEYTRLRHILAIHKKHEALWYCQLCETDVLLHDKNKHMLESHGTHTVATCPACDQVFSSRRLFTVHARREHMNDYRYECHVCRKKFFRRSSLTFHMPTHTGERNFKCKVCEKSYPRLKTLKEHMRIHTNDRRYRCHICGQAFIQNCSLKGHMKSKHPDCE